jgi:hypothetical protein
MNMITTFNLSADELDMSVLKSIKEAFKGKKIEIIVSDSVSKTSVLEERIKNLKNNKNIVSFSQEDFFKIYKKKISEAAN